MIENLPMSAAFLNPAALSSKRKSLYARLFDRLGQGGGEPLVDDQKESLIRQGLLNMGVGMLQTKGQGFGGALGAGLQSGLLAVNQGAQDIGNTRYKNEILARTRQGMERNTAMEQAQQGLFNSDGTLNPEKYGEFIQKFPMEALDIKSKATPKPQNDWSLAQIGDGEGGTVDVWVNKDTRQLRDLTGNPIGGDGFLSGATVADGPQQPTTGFLGADALPALEQAVMQVESRGNPDAVSPKGALGTMQTMPGTLTDPGYGVAPARDRSPAELERVGKDYLRAMLNQYGDPRLALAAYNWGPGNVDAAMKQGGGVEGVLARAPAETRAYVPKVLSQLEGGSAPSPMQSRLGRRPAKASQGAEESFGQPQAVTGPDGKLRFVQFGNRGGTREVDNYSAAPTDRDAKPPTEGERKAATLLKRLSFSQEQLAKAVQDSPSAASPNLSAEAASRIPFVGRAAANTMTPAARQRVEAAQLDILDAALTLGTGAAYTKEQLEGYRHAYFPQIGDDKTTIADKAARLKNVIEAAEIAAGRASPDNQEREQRAPKTPPGWAIQRED
jgi:hypothetical protein